MIDYITITKTIDYEITLSKETIKDFFLRLVLIDDEDEREYFVEDFLKRIVYPQIKRKKK